MWNTEDYDYIADSHAETHDSHAEMYNIHDETYDGTYAETADRTYAETAGSHAETYDGTYAENPFLSGEIRHMSHAAYHLRADIYRDSSYDVTKDNFNNAVDQTQANVKTEDPHIHDHTSDADAEFELDLSDREFGAPIGNAQPNLTDRPSSLTKRLQSLPSLRSVDLRPGRRLFQRKNNFEAIHAQEVGEEVAHPCHHCQKGCGPFTLCVAVDGELQGRCANCYYSSEPWRCSLNVSKKELDFAIAQPKKSHHARTKPSVIVKTSINENAPPTPVETNFALSVYRRLDDQAKAQFQIDMETLDTIKSEDSNEGS